MRNKETIEKVLELDQSYLTKVLERGGNRNQTYILNGSGCRSDAKFLDCVLYRACVYLAILSGEAQEPFVLMITASHNPANYNGFKIGTAGEQIISKTALRTIEEGINNQEIFESYVRDNMGNGRKHRKWETVFIGRDCRNSSLNLSQIATSVFRMFHIRVVNIGECSTPEVFSFSNYIFSELMPIVNQENALAYHKQYITEVVSEFEGLYEKLLQLKFPKWNKRRPRVLLDFANGSGAVSFRKYQQAFEKFFNIKSINDKQFSKPNYLCGAEHVQKNWGSLNPENFDGQYDFCFFFDGDSDRVLCKIKGSSELCDGNSLLAFYIKTLLKIREQIPQQIKLKIQQKIGNIEIRAVGNINSNQGLIEEIKKMKVEILRADVGVQNLYEAALKDCVISAFFQPNGHGGILLSKEFHQTILQFRKKYPKCLELQFLCSIFTILRNNARGFALHNVLIFFLCQTYLSSPGEYQSKFYVPYSSATKEVHVDWQFFESIRNGEEKLYLEKPASLGSELQEIAKAHPSASIVVRKSGTEKGLIRIQIQAEKAEVCSQIAETINQIIQKHAEGKNSNLE